MQGKHKKAALGWRAQGGGVENYGCSTTYITNDGAVSRPDDVLDELLDELRARAEGRMVPWQEQWFDELPADIERRKAAVYAKICEYRYSDHGGVMIDTDWPFWEALTAEFNRLTHIAQAERRRSA